MEKEEDGLVLVHTTDKNYKAELIVGLLSDRGIKAEILNKRDSCYLIGPIEIYVSKEDAASAKEIIEERK